MAQSSKGCVILFYINPHGPGHLTGTVYAIYPETSHRSNHPGPVRLPASPYAKEDPDTLATAANLGLALLEQEKPQFWDGCVKSGWQVGG